MSPQEIAGVLILLVSVYFLFRLGFKLAENSFNDNAMPWIGTGVALFFGWAYVNSGELSGFLGFIPIITYVVFRIFQEVNIDYTTKKKLKASIISGLGGTAVYLFTHSTFGFGIPEASLSAVIASAILGVAGYTA